MGENLLSEEGHVQVEFFTKQAGVDFPATPLSMPVSSSVEQMNSLINQLMLDRNSKWAEKNFDFLIGGILLRVTLKEFVQEHAISTEKVVQIEVVVGEAAPLPESEFQHEDWVGAVTATPSCIISGCYDNSVNVWSRQHGSILRRGCLHDAAVKCLCLIGEDAEKEEEICFASGSHDQLILLWQYSVSDDELRNRVVLKGHERSVECVCSNKDGSRLVSGGFDSFLKVWNTDVGEEIDQGAGDVSSKKRKLNDKVGPQAKAPMVTLAGHKEAITGVCWSTSRAEVCTASWDQSIIVWDLELAGQKSSLNGSRAFTSLSCSPISGLLVTASVDKNVRLWDPRSREGSVVKKMFTSHNAWVSTVKWSKTKENLFISAGYDKTMKLWDTRSPKAPLYDMKGHTDRVLCADWSESDLMISGGVDGTVKAYRSG